MAADTQLEITMRDEVREDEPGRESSNYRHLEERKRGSLTKINK